MNNYEAMLYLEVTKEIEIPEALCFKIFPVYIIFGSINSLTNLMKTYQPFLVKHHLEIYHHKKLIDYYDIRNTKARIEYGSIIRSNVTISDSAIILMGAIVNTNVYIGNKTMIDMNAVIGSGAIIKDNCHIGAGAVVAGVMEPVELRGVIIENDVLIGANATVLAGITIGKGSIVGAGSVVTEDVMEYTTVVGVPAKVISHNKKWKINECLR